MKSNAMRRKQRYGEKATLWVEEQRCGKKATLEEKATLTYLGLPVGKEHRGQCPGQWPYIYIPDTCSLALLRSDVFSQYLPITSVDHRDRPRLGIRPTALHQRHDPMAVWHALDIASAGTEPDSPARRRR